MTLTQLREIETQLTAARKLLEVWDDDLTDLRDDVRHVRQKIHAAQRDIQSIIGDNPMDPWHGYWRPRP